MSGPDCETCGEYFMDCNCETPETVSEKYIDPVLGCPVIDPMQQILDKIDRLEKIVCGLSQIICEKVDTANTKLNEWWLSLEETITALRTPSNHWISIRNRWPENAGRYWVKDSRHDLEGWANYDGYQWDTPEFDLPKKGSLLLVHYTVTHWKQQKEKNDETVPI